MELANKLLNGKFHEQDEDEVGNQSENDGNKEIRFQSKQDFDHEKKLEQFETALRKIFDDHKNEESAKTDEIPITVRR